MGLGLYCLVWIVLFGVILFGWFSVWFVFVFCLFYVVVLRGFWDVGGLGFAFWWVCCELSLGWFVVRCFGVLDYWWRFWVVLGGGLGLVYAFACFKLVCVLQGLVVGCGFDCLGGVGFSYFGFGLGWVV